MSTELDLLALRNNIEDAFKSLIKSGRPDIKDENNNNITSTLYVDLFENDYILNQALDENHVIFKGRKGTGKSTVFLHAEKIISKDKGKISIYLNLQSCYEEIKTSDADTSDNLTRYNVYYNFFNEILSTVKKNIRSLFKNNSDFDALFNEIKNGEYVDADFLRVMQVNNNNEKTKHFSLNLSGGAIAAPRASAELSVGSKKTIEETQELKEIRVYSINKILTKLKEILLKHNVSKVYLFLDDFSELSFDNQKMVIDSLVSPIITSYNDMFVVKLAAYPYRIYLGNIDSSKILHHSLDFYEVYEKTSKTYVNVEESAINYLKRTLVKRIEVYTKNQIKIDEIFDTSKDSIDEYLKILFYASSSIPRSLGYILTYCYLSSINQGKRINIQDINNASRKYYTDNVLPDFFNDARFKQSFYDDKEILNQLAQKSLMEQLIDMSKKFKRECIHKMTRSSLKQIFHDTLSKYRKGRSFWLPSSHFYVEKGIESILQTLELYFIVNKFNEGSSRQPGKKVSYYGLNYGLCLENGVDYGKPESRRAYDYWRQDEFDYTEIIPSILSSIEIPVCCKCEYEYKDETEFEIAKKFKRCLKCGNENTVYLKNKFEESFKDKLNKWKNISLPDLHISILRTMYNNRNSPFTAHEIGLEVDKHHLSITKAISKLSSLGYVSYETRNIRYYSIEDAAIIKFFSID